MTEDSRNKKERNWVDKKKCLRKEKRKNVKKRKLIDLACESNIKIVFEEHVSTENVHPAGRW